MHIVFLAVLGLLLFGPKRLPEIGRSLGSGIREFKSTVTGEEKPELESHKLGTTDANDAPDTAADDASH